MNPFQAVRDTIREEIGIQQLPPFLDQTVEVFNKVHLYYRTFKQATFLRKAAQDPSKGNPAVYGAALHLLGDYTSIGSYAVNVALVTKCAQDLLQEYRNLSVDYNVLCQTIKWQYPLYYPIEWKRGKPDAQSILSPSFYLSWHVQEMGFVRQILKITRCALHVFWQLFKLSMSLCDAYLLLNGDSQARYEGCTELIAEWDNYQKHLKESQKFLMKEIEKGSQLADRILEHLAIKNNSSSILAQLKPIIQGLKIDSQTSHDLFETFQETWDIVYAKGKITPLHIDLAEGTAAPSTLPHGRFPPWAGQQVELIKTKTENSAPFNINSLYFKITDLGIKKRLKELNWLIKLVQLADNTCQ
jgi:hypothetical protein